MNHRDFDSIDVLCLFGFGSLAFIVALSLFEEFLLFLAQ